MEIKESILKRFHELDKIGESLPRGSDYEGKIYEPAAWRQWATSAQHLIDVAFGITSSHYRNFQSGYDGCNGFQTKVDSLKGIFRAAKSDFEAGLSNSISTLVSGEIYGDFIGLAKRALTEGSKDVAAVLACAALEDALKRYALRNDLDVSEKSMQEVVSALKSKGIVSGAQKSLLDTMPKIRDYAMHANWDKITNQDVGSVIGFVEQLLLSKFS